MRTAALYAGLHGLILIVLMASVSMARRRVNAMLGDGGDPVLNRRIRALGNFAEYVPFALLLLALSQHLGLGSLYVHLLGLILLVTRISHAYGISQQDETLIFRMIGMAGTLFVLLVTSVYCIIAGL